MNPSIFSFNNLVKYGIINMVTLLGRTLMIIFFLAAIILFIIAIVSIISALIKKKSKKNALVFFISSIVCFFISYGMSPATTTTEKTNEPNSSNVEKDNQDNKNEKSYKIGDTIKVSTSNGSYSITISGVTETDDRNQFSDVKADRVVIIDYAYENIDVNDELYISESNFKAYDADNNSLETYPADTKHVDSIGSGRKTTGQMAFALNNSTNKIELEYFDNMFNDSKDCLIVLEW